MGIYDIAVTDIRGAPLTLNVYRGKTLLVVNVASRCGYTPQYEGLEALYRRYEHRGFAILGFPCDQFGHQEPGNEAQIAQFCLREYGVTFPLFAKIDVNGPNAHPLYRFLTSKKKGLFGRRAISWNFSKFLVDRQGEVVRRYGPRDTPARIEPVVVQLLG